LIKSAWRADFLLCSSAFVQKGQSAKEFAATEKDPAVCCLEALFLS
jgi:hypothetical protein